jgi:phosphoglycolate phosphatase
MGRIKAVLFDKDGTLLDFERTWGPACRALFLELCAGDMSRAETLASATGFRLHDLAFAVDSPLIAGSISQFSGLFAQELRLPDGEELQVRLAHLFDIHGRRHATALAGVGPVLRRLTARGLALGVATNGGEAEARGQIEALGWTPLFPFIAGYDSGYGSKPAPGMVAAFVDWLGLEPDEVGMVGDSVHDMQAARSAGVMAVGVLTGPRGLAAHDDLAAHADAILTSLDQLPAWLMQG